MSDNTEMREATRDLCAAVAELAYLTEHLLRVHPQQVLRGVGTGRAEAVIGQVLSVSKRMDALEDTDE